jgi:hypothetical protein
LGASLGIMKQVKPLPARSATRSAAICRACRSIHCRCGRMTSRCARRRTTQSCTGHLTQAFSKL